MTYLHDKCVVLTGAGGGFGKLMTERFLAEGSRVILADKTREAITGSTGDTFNHSNVVGTIAADLDTAAGCEQLYHEVMQLTPHIDILVNNAGIGLSGMFVNTPQDRWQQLLEINLLAPLRLTHHFLPGMIARKSGHIVNISSAAGLLGTPGLAAYSTAKAGLRGFGQALCNEVSRHQIAVTTVYPFFARTNILHSPYFGDEGTRASLPNRIVNDPVPVVDAIMRGIRMRKVHVYPDNTVKLIVLLSRLMPGQLDRIQRYMTK